MFSSTIIVIPKHFQNTMTFRNFFFMARRMCVQPSLLARLATVSVLLFSWRGISCPVEPAVNRQPGFCRELVEQSAQLTSSFWESLLPAPLELKNQKPLTFHKNVKIFEKSSLFSNFHERYSWTKLSISDEFVLSFCWEFEFFGKENLLKNL